mmetsp:Transcript_17389/g.54406  ORF Transcript_17389/g.54406 Transcript_17389/m.54406 type:complete len:217 (+) Transcript_17389:860-1510(+)
MDGPGSTSMRLVSSGASGASTAMNPDFRASGAAFGRTASCAAATCCSTLPCRDRTVSCGGGRHGAAGLPAPAGGAASTGGSPVAFFGMTRMLMRPDLSASTEKRSALLLPPVLPPLSCRRCLRTASSTSCSLRPSWRPHARMRSSRRKAPLASTRRPAGRLSGYRPNAASCREILSEEGVARRGLRERRGMAAAGAAWGGGGALPRAPGPQLEAHG